MKASLVGLVAALGLVVLAGCKKDEKAEGNSAASAEKKGPQTVTV
jgi:hypothetical protein